MVEDEDEEVVVLLVVVTAGIAEELEFTGKEEVDKKVEEDRLSFSVFRSDARIGLESRPLLPRWTGSIVRLGPDEPIESRLVTKGTIVEVSTFKMGLSPSPKLAISSTSDMDADFFLFFTTLSFVCFLLFSLTISSGTIITFVGIYCKK